MYCKFCGKPLERPGKRCKHCGRDAIPLEGGIGFWDICRDERPPEQDRTSSVSLYIVLVILAAALCMSVVAGFGIRSSLKKSLDSSLVRNQMLEQENGELQNSMQEAKSGQKPETLVLIEQPTDCTADAGQTLLFTLTAMGDDCGGIWQKENEEGQWEPLDWTRFTGIAQCEGGRTVFQLECKDVCADDAGLYRCLLFTSDGGQLESGHVQLYVSAIGQNSGDMKSTNGGAGGTDSAAAPTAASGSGEERQAASEDGQQA